MLISDDVLNWCKGTFQSPKFVRIVGEKTLMPKSVQESRCLKPWHVFRMELICLSFTHPLTALSLGKCGVYGCAKPRKGAQAHLIPDPATEIPEAHSTVNPLTPDRP